jgi:hypothetical protein
MRSGHGMSPSYLCRGCFKVSAFSLEENALREEMEDPNRPKEVEDFATVRHVEVAWDLHPLNGNTYFNSFRINAEEYVRQAFRSPVFASDESRNSGSRIAAQDE